MVKVLNLPRQAWSIIFICIQVINFGFLVGALDYDYWFSQKWTYQGVTYTFKGSLIGPKKDLGICDSGDTFNDCNDECNNNCDRYKAWYSGGAAYIAFGVIASILTVFIALILVLDAVKLGFLHRFNRYFHMLYTSILLIFVLFFHFLGFIIWAGTVKLRFKDCSHRSNYKGTRTVCGEGGAVLSLFTLIWLLLVTPVYTLISFKIYKEEKNQGRSGNEEMLREI